MPKFSQQFYIDTGMEEIYHIYDIVLKYFISQGFAVTHEVKPAQCTFKRGTHWTLDMDVKKQPQKLTVTLPQQNEGMLVSCLYEIDDLLITSKTSLQAEVEGLKTYILAAIQQDRQAQSPRGDRICVECKRNIPFDANICPYCGHDYRKV